jgi:hypothetical protein
MGAWTGKGEAGASADGLDQPVQQLLLLDRLEAAPPVLTKNAAARPLMRFTRTGASYRLTRERAAAPGSPERPRSPCGPDTHSGEGLAEMAAWLMASSGAAEASQIQVAIEEPHGLAAESCALGQGARRGLRLSIAACCTIHGPAPRHRMDG